MITTEAARREQQGTIRWWRSAAAMVALIAAIKLVGTMIVSDRYGFHRDELYYLACARHLALGYVDFPPITPLIARLDMAIFGTSLPGLRLASVLAGTAVIVLAALMARELGGGRLAQIVAAGAVLLSPPFLGGNILFQTVSFDQLVWAIALYLVARLLTTGDLRLWLALGVVFGIGLETKYTVLALALGLFAGLLLTPLRAQLRMPWPWLGAVIALVILAPNLVWQVQHDWPSLTYITSHHGNTGSRLSFFLETLFLLGPVGLPLAVLGIVQLFKPGHFPLLGWTSLLTVLILFLSGGKSYYAAPLYPLLLASGSVWIERALPRRRTLLLVLGALLTLVNLLLLPLGLPVLPARTAVQMGLTDARKDYADMFGWQEMTALTARVYRSLPLAERRHATIWAINYGEAGALDLYGPRYGLPPVISSHLTYFYWKPSHVEDQTVIVVGDGGAWVRRLFADVRRVATIRNAYGVKNEENGRPIYLCRRPKVSFDRVWPSLQFYD